MAVLGGSAESPAGAAAVAAAAAVLQGTVIKSVRQTMGLELLPTSCPSSTAAPAGSSPAGHFASRAISSLPVHSLRRVINKLEHERHTWHASGYADVLPHFNRPTSCAVRSPAACMGGPSSTCSHARAHPKLQRSGRPRLFCGRIRNEGKREALVVRQLRRRLIEQVAICAALLPSGLLEHGVG